MIASIRIALSKLSTEMSYIAFIPIFSAVSLVHGVTTQIDHCIVEGLFVPQGTTWQPKGKCQQASCQGKNVTTYLRCEAVTAPQGWTPIPEDVSKPYPDCCPKAVPPGTVLEPQIPDNPEALDKPETTIKPEIPQLPGLSQLPELPQLPALPPKPGVPFRPGRPQRPYFFLFNSCPNCGCNFMAWCLGIGPEGPQRPNSSFSNCHFSQSWCFGNRPGTGRVDVLSSECSDSEEDWKRRTHGASSEEMYGSSSEDY